MLLTILLFSLYLSQLNAIIPYDGIIHRSSDGSSYAFLDPPKASNHASFIEKMTPSGTLAVAWFSGGEQQPNCSIAVSLLELGSQQFTAGVIVSERVNYSNQNPVLFWDNQTQILHLYHTQQLGHLKEYYTEMWHLHSKDRGEYTLEIYILKKIILIFVRCNMVNS
jgi:predicted neuraminidase